MADKMRSPFPFRDVCSTNKGKLTAAIKALLPGRLTAAPAMTPFQDEIARLGLELFVNKTGSTIAAGLCLQPELTLNTVVSTETVVDNTALTIADGLTVEVGTFRLVFLIGTGDLLAGNIVIVGIDENGTAIEETVVCGTTNATQWTSVNLYTTVTSITPGTCAANSGTLAVTASPVDACEVAGAAQDGVDVTGVCHGAVGGFDRTAVPDEGYGYKATAIGATMEIFVTAADQAAGTLLGTSNGTAGYLAAHSSAAHGGNVAKLLDYNRAESAADLRLFCQFLGGT